MATSAQTKQQIEEIEPFEAAAEIEGGDVVLIDTREPHEYQEAHLEGGKLVPPGLLGDEIAEAAPDKSARTILYCRSGNRSFKAAEQMQELGLRGRRLDGRRDPRLAGAGAAGRRRDRDDPRAARPLLAPHASSRGRGRRPDQAAQREGAADRRRRPRRADRALPRRGRDRHHRPRRRRRRRRLQPAAPGDPQHRADRRAEDLLGAEDDRGAEPGRRRRRAQPPPRRRQHHRADPRLRRDRRRRRQLPDPLPAQRCLGAAAQAGRLGVDPQLRRPDLDLRPVRGAVLPLPLPDPAAGRAGAELLRQRRPRRDGGDDGHAPGQRGDQAGARDRRAADRPPAPLRGARHPLHRAQGPPRPRVPDLR